VKIPANIRNYVTEVTTLDSRSLALFRILLGVVTIVDLLDRASVFEAMYSESGLIPLKVVRETYGQTPFGWSHFSIHMLNGSQIYQAGLLCIAGICAAFVSIGYRTRLFLIASWFLHASIMTRNPVYASAADVTLGLALFWAIFLPLGNRFSVDRIKGRSGGSLGNTALRVGVACYLIQLFTIYFCAAYEKDGTWRDGSALMTIMNIDLLVTNFGRYLTNFPTLLSFLTLSAWWLEAVGTLLLFSPFRMQGTRGLCFLSFFGLHFGIALTCDIGLFPFFSMVLWLPVIPGYVWDWLGINSNQEMKPNSERSTKTTGDFKNTREIVCILFAVGSILAVMLTTFDVGRWGVVHRVAHAYVRRVKLSQHWAVFARTEYLKRDGWFIVEGTLANGELVDLLRGNEPVQWTRPPLTGPRRVSIIWRTYLAHQERRTRDNLDRYASFLYRKNKLIRGHGLEKIRMIFMEEESPENDNVSPNVFWSGTPQ